MPVPGYYSKPDRKYLPHNFHFPSKAVAVPIVQLACSFIDELRIICNQVVFRLPKNLIQNGNWNQPALDQFMKHIASHDIVNIGLHFFLKNVRPYAASCSEA